jgi:soluble cytochrome b562
VSAAAEGLAVRVTDADATAVPDAQARRAYRARLAELRAELDEAEGFADAGRAERLREELDRLTDELATRFGGKTPRQGQAETARKAVTKVLRTQIARLLDAHPELGRHLRDTVRLGTVCVYAPTTPIDWDVAFAPA